MAKNGGRRTILEHLGSANTDSELAALMQVTRDKLDEGQEELDLGLDALAEKTRTTKPRGDRR
ncbi:hypothetical protein P3H15_37285 [Rhodococcus sp. T2V]|uniref:hypothetical protein n=1 Tax=Rhodococcus sp. T2V TaxID=3034164 RepID=UPI0023E1A45F|nr:hypothetical protein [Rhodococcus sp. T2V]MDF3310672.1 hypothetical protein [Rhodococcus sp. T2V]